MHPPHPPRSLRTRFRTRPKQLLEHLSNWRGRRRRWIPSGGEGGYRPCDPGLTSPASLVLNRVRSLPHPVQDTTRTPKRAQKIPLAIRQRPRWAAGGSRGGAGAGGAALRTHRTHRTHRAHRAAGGPSPGASRGRGAAGRPSAAGTSHRCTASLGRSAALGSPIWAWHRQSRGGCGSRRSSS